MDFEEFCNLLSEYFDEELGPRSCRDMEEMIASDSCCRTVFNTFNKTLKLCRQLQAEEMEVPEEIRVNLYRYLRIEISRGHKESSG